MILETCIAGLAKISLNLIEVQRSLEIASPTNPILILLESCMAVERTLSIIKPDAVAKNIIGQIYRRFEDRGLRIVAARMLHLDREQAGQFYAIHRERRFFGQLIDYMTSGPVMVQVLEGENAIALNREIMGATDPQQAAPGTIRADFAQSITENAVHGSDAPETAAEEIAYFFSGLELVG